MPNNIQEENPKNIDLETQYLFEISPYNFFEQFLQKYVESVIKWHIFGFLQLSKKN